MSNRGNTPTRKRTQIVTRPSTQPHARQHTTTHNWTRTRTPPHKSYSNQRRTQTHVRTHVTDRGFPCARECAIANARTNTYTHIYARSTAIVRGISLTPIALPFDDHKSVNSLGTKQWQFKGLRAYAHADTTAHTNATRQARAHTDAHGRYFNSAWHQVEAHGLPTLWTQKRCHFWEQKTQIGTRGVHAGM